MDKFKPGDKIVFCRCKRNRGLVDITIGKIYEVDSFCGDIAFIDDEGDLRYGLDGPGDISDLKVTKIID